jgi:hypothetical protein
VFYDMCIWSLPLGLCVLLVYLTIPVTPLCHVLLFSSWVPTVETPNVPRGRLDASAPRHMRLPQASGNTNALLVVTKTASATRAAETSENSSSTQHRATES